MKIEVLYPEICCLYGDKGNMMYLRHYLPDAQFVETSLTSVPSFVGEDVALIYMCSMSETNQELAIDLLLPHRDRLRTLMDSQTTVFLLTGNSFEVFGHYIEREDGSRIEGLGLLDSYAVRQVPRRFNSLVRGEFESMTILGYTSRFSHSYSNDPASSFIRVNLGTGLNPTSDLEGIHVGQVFATYLLGPLLVNNPDFTKHLLSCLGAPTPTLPFESDIYHAYATRLADYAKPGIDLS